MILTIEGIDGSGKHTLAAELTARAASEGYQIGRIAFPRYGRSLSSSAISALLATTDHGSSNEPKLAAALFACDRLEARQHLLDAASSKALLIVDRYVHSNIVYQASRTCDSDRKLIMDWIAHLEFDVFDVPRPDLTILRDIDPGVAMARTQKRAIEGGRLEDDSYEADYLLQSTARDIYRTLCAEQSYGDWVLDDSQAADSLSVGGAVVETTRALAEALWEQQVVPRMGA